MKAPGRGFSACSVLEGERGYEVAQVYGTNSLVPQKRPPRLVGPHRVDQDCPLGIRLVRVLPISVNFGATIGALTPSVRAVVSACGRSVKVRLQILDSVSAAAFSSRGTHRGFKLM